MADIGRSDNNSAFPRRIGELVYLGDSPEALEAASFTITDTVGSAGLFSDFVDQFSFTPVGVTEVRVDVNIFAEGDYVTLFSFVPTIGLISIEGPVVLTSVGGFYENEFESDRFQAPGSDLLTQINSGANDILEVLQEVPPGDIGVSYSNAEAALNVRGTTSTNWHTSSSSVQFGTRGFTLQGIEENGDFGPAEVSYSIKITPIAGEILEREALGRTFSVLHNEPGEIQGDWRIDTFRSEAFRRSFDLERVDDNEFNLIYGATSYNSEDTFRLVDIEVVVAIDGFYSLDTDGNSGQVYRLYQAAFDRTPDPEGLGFWLRNYTDDNVDLVQMATEFIDSPEFTQTYGSSAEVDDELFLKLLYDNVLDRTPDADGFEFWANEQESGISRSQMLTYFSESAENIAKVAPAIEDGIWYL